jgi:hypothetical protein
MVRPTKEFKTPSEKSVVMYEYVTGRDMKAVSLLESEKDKALDAMIEASVVSLDGSSENTLERILDLPGSDYVFIVQKASDLFNIVNEEKKSHAKSK